MADSISTEPSTGRATLGPGQVSVTGDIALATGKTLAAGENVLVSGDNLRESHLAVGSQAAGDLLYAASSSTWARLGVGADGDVLTLDEGLPTWQAPAGGGSTVQQLRWSTVDRVAQRGVTPSAGSSAITFGTVWTPLRRLTVTGIRFYWRAAGDVVTVTWWLPDGTVGRSVTVSTGGMSGIFTGTFATPLQVAAGDVGKQHAATTFDNGHYTYSVGEAAGGFPIIQRPKSSFLAGPWVQLAVYDGGSGFYATGGGYAVPNFPDGGDAHVDPIFADDVP